MIQYRTLISFDWAMKRLLRNKANYDILEGFISVLLKDDIKIERILESESNQDDKFDKYNRLDILAENSNQELIIVEIQYNRQVHYFERMLYGVSKAIVENISLGDDYQRIKKVYSVNIVYFDLGQGTDYVYHGKTEFKGIHNNDVLQLSSKQKDTMLNREISSIYPEYYVLKVNQFDDYAKDSLDEWIYYLKNSKIKEGSSAQGLEKVADRMRLDEMNEQERSAFIKEMDRQRDERDTIAAGIEDGIAIGYDKGLDKGKEEGIKVGKEEGIKVGKEEGKRESLKQIVLNSKKSGLSIEVIKSITGLCEEEINSIN